MKYTGTMDGASYDELFGGAEITVLNKNITFTKGANYKRGMLLSETDGKATATAKGGVALYVCANDLDLTNTETDEVGTVYTSGRYNREKVIVADGDTVEAHEVELRPLNILFTSLHN